MTDSKGAQPRFGLRHFAALWLLLLIAKAYLAANLDLFGDEAFYWQEAQRLALAYADHPPLTALLIRAGTALLGDTPLGVRVFFLVLGSAIPWLVLWLARPIVGLSVAVQAAALSLALPLAALLGVAALPDVPLLFFTLVALGGFERALRRGRLGDWCLFGVGLAGGLATHYRFVLVPAAAFLYLVVTRVGRAQWRIRGLWAAAGIGFLGLLPVVLFNWQEQFAPLRYQFGERHPWAFHPDGLLHVLEQAGASSPLLYGFLIAGLIHALRRARCGAVGYGLLGVFATVPVLTFALLAPFADQKHFTLHWPLGGYLAALPPTAVLISAWSQRGGWRRLIALATPVTGIVGTLGMAGYYGAVANLEHLHPLLPPGQARSDMAGWRQLAAHTRRVLAIPPETSNRTAPSALLADRYYTAAQLDFELGGEISVGHLNEYKAHSHGRARQYELWGIDEAGFRTAHSGASVLVIVDESKARYGFKRYARVRALCGMFDRLSLMDTAEIFGGAQRYRFFLGEGLRRPGQGRLPDAQLPVGEDFKPFLPLPADCPVPSFGDISAVEDGSRFAGVVELRGWAFNNSAAVSRVDLLLDREPVAQGDYGQRHAHLSRAEFWKDGVSSPDAPNVGFTVRWDTRGTAKGRYELALQVTTRTGRVDRLVKREIWVD